MAGDKDATYLNSLRGVAVSAQVKTSSTQEREKEKVIREGIEKVRPSYTHEEKEATIAKLMTKPAGTILKDGGKNVLLEDFAFELADSIQRIESGTDPQEEYLEWMEKGPEIISKMNRPGATDEEMFENLKERNDFLENLDQREMEMKNCIFLYRMSSSERAKKRLEFLMTKWARLMEIRSAIKASTLDRVKTQKEKREEEARMRRAVGYITTLAVADQAVKDQEFYALRIDEAQDLITAMTTGRLDLEKLKWRQNFLLSLSERQRELLMRKDLLYKLNLATNVGELAAIQRELAQLAEMEKIVRLATRDPKQALNNMELTKEDMERGEIYNVVLEYRRRGKEVPERVLYQLGINSFEPEYDIANALTERHQGTQPSTRDDVIKRINELRGRQSSFSGATNNLRSRVNVPRAWSARQYSEHV